MQDINFIAVTAAVVAAFIVSGVWYSIFGQALTDAQGKKAGGSDGMQPWQIGAEAVRSIIVALALAYLLGKLDVSAWDEAVWYALLLWVTFPVVLLLGSMVHEKVPFKLASIHAGDWLIKLIAISLIVGLWNK
jgi:hypothetical protein